MSTFNKIYNGLVGLCSKIRNTSYSFPFSTIKYHNIKFTFLVITFFIISSSFDNNIEKSTHTSIDNSKNPRIELYRDTLSTIENRGLKMDSLEFKQFYCNATCNLFYHKSGKLFLNEVKNGISLYSISDTVIRLNLLQENDRKWCKMDSVDLHISSFSPAFFSIYFDDYNLDGIKDLYVVFYQSMSVAYSYGYLITVIDHAEQLNLIEESIDIPNLFMNNNKMESVTYNHPGHETASYRKTEEYKLLHNELVIYKTNTKYLEK